MKYRIYKTSHKVKLLKTASYKICNETIYDKPRGYVSWDTMHNSVFISVTVQGLCVNKSIQLLLKSTKKKK